MESEYETSFIYKTVKNYKNFEEFIKEKLLSNTKDEYFNEGYLIDKKYLDFWKNFTDYNTIKNEIAYKDYKSARKIINNYRRKNKIKHYQEDASQYTFLTPVTFFQNLKNEEKQYALIDQNFWKLICKDEGVDEEGGMRYNIKKGKIIFNFGKLGKAIIKTKDNIINGEKEIFIESINRELEDEGEESELKKLFLLYAYEQELKSKINNLKYKEHRFKKYYLLSKDWILEYKKYYHYEELSEMINNRNDLSNILNKGYNYAKENIDYILSQILITRKKPKENFPNILRDDNTYLSEGGKLNINNQSLITYWKEFELINEDLNDLFSKSEFHEYNIENSSSSLGLINQGKIILDLSNDKNNEGIIALEIGVIDNKEMIFSDEYIFRYDSEQSKNEHFKFFNDKFYLFQKDDLNFDINLECDLIKDNGEICGTAFKIPPHI